MSQEKVNAYLEAKKTRKQNIEKEKNRKNARKVIFWVVALALAGIMVFLIALSIRNEVVANESEKESINAAFKETSYLLQDYATMQPTETMTTGEEDESTAAATEAEATEAEATEAK